MTFITFSSFGWIISSPVSETFLLWGVQARVTGNIVKPEAKSRTTGKSRCRSASSAVSWMNATQRLKVKIVHGKDSHIILWDTPCR